MESSETSSIQPSTRFRAVKLSAFDGLKTWGIEDVWCNGDNLLRDWRYRGTKRKVWRGCEEEAVHVARELNLHPKIMEKDAKQSAHGGRTGAILARQRAPRTHGATRVAPGFKRCDACNAMYKGEHTCT